MRELLGVGFVIFTISSAYADSNWNMLTTSRGGVVSLIHGLTERDCDFWRKKLLHIPATPDEIAAKAALDKRRVELRDALLDDAKAECKKLPGGDGPIELHTPPNYSHVWCEKGEVESWYFNSVADSVIYSASPVSLESGDIHTAECFK